MFPSSSKYRIIILIMLLIRDMVCGVRRASSEPRARRIVSVAAHGKNERALVRAACAPHLPATVLPANEEHLQKYHSIKKLVEKKVESKFNVK